MRMIDLEAAYQQTEETIRRNSRSFHFATSWLPKADRRAIRALYGFCRATDDVVDDPARLAFANLDAWRAQVNRPSVEQSDPLLKAWADTRVRYHVPQVYADELIEGCEMDLTKSRYETFPELERYCYCVASTVGLMAMHVFGTATGIEYEDAKPYAIKLGVALQLTKILRDVGEDARKLGRIYLPLEDLAQFNVTEEDILCGHLTGPMIRLLQFEIERAHHLYEEAWPGIGFLARKARFSVAVAAEVYRGILSKISANRYDVFNQRAYLTKSEKLVKLPGIWVRTQRLATP